MSSTKRHAKRTPPEHLVIVDSSVLWHADKAYVVNPEFEAVWRELGEVADLTLGIPEVVRGELLFQQTSSALRTLARANAELDTLSASTGVTHQLGATEQVISHQVQERLDGWIRETRCRILPTPLSTLDWSALVDASIWRKPPFTLDKSANVEKGFRDALILETVLSTLDETDVPRIAFVCADKLLAETTIARAGTKAKLFVQESIASFASYLRLDQETLTEQFVTSVVEGAAGFFFKKSDEATLYYTARVREQIEREFSGSMQVNELGAELLFSIAPENSPSPWIQVGRQRIRVGQPQFLRIEDPETFHWRSPVTVVRAYQRERPKNDFARAFGPYEQNVLMLRIRVEWHAVVDAEGVFSQGVVDALSESGRDFQAASSTLITKYDLRGLSPGLFG